MQFSPIEQRLQLRTLKLISLEPKANDPYIIALMVSEFLVSVATLHQDPYILWTLQEFSESETPQTFRNSPFFLYLNKAMIEEIQSQPPYSGLTDDLYLFWTENCL